MNTEEPLWKAIPGTYDLSLTNSQAVNVFGQSAGGHLAAWLVAHQPLDLKKAFLLYPPTDMLEFLSGAVPSNGSYQNYRDFGLKSISNYYGSSKAHAEVRLQDIDYISIDMDNLPANIVPQIPDSTFNLTGVNALNPPSYVQRCAELLGVDLTTTDLVSPPLPLLHCLK